MDLTFLTSQQGSAEEKECQRTRKMTRSCDRRGDARKSRRFRSTHCRSEVGVRFGLLEREKVCPTVSLLIYWHCLLVPPSFYLVLRGSHSILWVPISSILSLLPQLQLFLVDTLISPIPTFWRHKYCLHFTTNSSNYPRCCSSLTPLVPSSQNKYSY